MSAPTVAFCQARANPPLQADEGRQRSRPVRASAPLRFVPSPCAEPYAAERPAVTPLSQGLGR